MPRSVFPQSELHVARAIAGQPAILEEMLKSGIPLVFCDKDGNMSQKNPDGTIEILEKTEAK
ncbi:MAG: hypothetical protein LBC94_05035 [Desulfovibrio sp.]|nr:hypothetical protein [Desulfovibrio sp.]